MFEKNIELNERFPVSEGFEIAPETTEPFLHREKKEAA